MALKKDFRGISIAQREEHIWLRVKTEMVSSGQK